MNRPLFLQRLAALSLCASLVWPLRGFAAEATSAPLPEQVRFEQHIRPLLKAHCFHCHGEQGHTEAKLDLRLAKAIAAGGDSGPAMIAGQPDQSLIVARVVAGEMPPKGNGLKPREIELLKRWIEQGSQTLRPEANAPSDENWTDEEKSWWAFQPVVRPALPQVGAADQVKTPVDNFLLQQLEKHQLGFSPEADRATLARRLSFDLTGLPLSPERTQQFVADPATDAVEQLVEELLASSAYGERWARHWLDPAGYADSDGYTEHDTVRPWSYRYRDYVIRAFNSDKPFDQFVVEQLAGDELLPQSFENLSPADVDRLIATGLIRTAPDGAGDEGAEAIIARNDVAAENIKIVSGLVLGMTVGCAQCHDHRYDPISQVDYYKMRAIFEPVYDPNNWRHKSSRLVNLWGPAEREQSAAVDKELTEINKKRFEELDQKVAEVYEKEIGKLPEELHATARWIRASPDDKQTGEQKQFLKDHPSLNVNRGTVSLYIPGFDTEFNGRYAALDKAANAKRPPQDLVACATEPPGQIPKTHMFNRGDVRQPKQEILPGELSVLPGSQMIAADDPALPTSGRRLAFARRLTDGKHPLLARTIVNRLWMHHFGRGIVASPGDFGQLGERPSHPELLDWLAAELVASGWSTKHIQRLIVTSAAYRQQSTRTGALEAVDPDNRLLGRAPVRRLEAEAIRDALIDVSGMEVSALYGPPSIVAPDDVGQIVIGTGERDGNGIVQTQASDDRRRFRRSIYVQVRRSMPLGVMEPFDLPTMAPACDRRSASTAAPQSLLMMNNAFVVEISERMATRIASEVGDDVAAQAQRAWSLAYGRPISPEEQAAAVELIVTSRGTFERQLAEAVAAAPADKPPPLASEPPPGRRALALLCHALISSNRFLYVD